MCRQKLDVNLAMPALCYVGNVVGLRVPTANSQRSWTRMECSSFHVPWRTKRGKIICFEGGYYCFCSGISQYSIATNIHFKYLWDNYHVIEKRSRRIDDVRKKKSDDKLPKAQQSHKEKTVFSFLFYIWQAKIFPPCVSISLRLLSLSSSPPHRHLCAVLDEDGAHWLDFRLISNILNRHMRHRNRFWERRGTM